MIKSLSVFCLSLVASVVTAQTAATSRTVDSLSDGKFTIESQYEGVRGSISGRDSGIERVKTDSYEMIVTYLRSQDGKHVTHFVYSDTRGRPIALVAAKGEERDPAFNMIRNEDTRSFLEITGEIRERGAELLRSVNRSVVPTTSSLGDMAKGAGDNREICFIRCEGSFNMNQNGCEATYNEKMSNCEALIDVASGVPGGSTVAAGPANLCRSSAINGQNACKNSAAREYMDCKIICMIKYRTENPYNP